MKWGVLFDLCLRYITLIVLGLLFMKIFYLIFYPLTVYPTQAILSIFFNVSKAGHTIYANGIPIEIIGACVAGSAYYLFLILNLATPNIEIKKRSIVLLLSFAVFLIINIIRIVLLASMSIADSPLFDFTHFVFWYFLSTIFIVLIWFYEVKKFKIKGIPFYSDIKTIFNNSSLKKRKKTKRSK